MAEIKFDCEHCGQVLEAPEEMAGEALACPSCEGTITVPRALLRTRPGAEDPVAAPTAPTPAPAMPDASGTGAQSHGRECPSCGNTMATDAVLCIECGYHFDSKKKLETQSGPKGGASKAGGGASLQDKLKIGGLIGLIVVAVIFIVLKALSG